MASGHLRRGRPLEPGLTSATTLGGLLAATSAPSAFLVVWVLAWLESDSDRSDGPDDDRRLATLSTIPSLGGYAAAWRHRRMGKMIEEHFDLSPEESREYVRYPTSDDAAIQVQTNGESNGVEVRVDARLSDIHRWDEDILDVITVDKNADKEIERFDITNVSQLRVRVVNTDGTAAAEGVTLTVLTSS